jgi:hypothetical protein
MDRLSFVRDQVSLARIDSPGSHNNSLRCVFKTIRHANIMRSSRYKSRLTKIQEIGTKDINRNPRFWQSGSNQSLFGRESLILRLSRRQICGLDSPKSAQNRGPHSRRHRLPKTPQADAFGQAVNKGAAVAAGTGFALGQRQSEGIPIEQFYSEVSHDDVHRKTEIFVSGRNQPAAAVVVTLPLSES